MSWFFIDTHVRGQVRLAELPISGAIRERTAQGRRSPVVAAASFFSSASRRRATGVCVVQGPGPFSAIRSGVLCANILSRVLRIPLVGVSVDESQDLAALRDALGASRFAPQSYVAPVYDAEPNIGKASS
jgi:hypothetical protein